MKFYSLILIFTILVGFSSSSSSELITCTLSGSVDFFVVFFFVRVGGLAKTIIILTNYTGFKITIFMILLKLVGN